METCWLRLETAPEARLPVLSCKTCGLRHESVGLEVVVALETCRLRLQERVLLLVKTLLCQILQALTRWCGRSLHAQWEVVARELRLQRWRLEAALLVRVLRRRGRTARRWCNKRADSGVLRCLRLIWSLFWLLGWRFSELLEE